MTASTHELLLAEPTYARMAEHIRAVCPEIRLSVMDVTGAVTIDGRAVAAQQLAPTICWPNLDVFHWEAQGRREYFRALLRSPALRWVQTAAAGVDDPVFARIVAKGCALTNSVAQAPAIADFILGAALDFYQQLTRRRELQTAHEWYRMPFRELGDTSWLIIGYGNIGRATAQRVRAFGASVTGIRRQPRPDPLADRMATVAELPACLPAADVVVLSCALTEATTDLANAEFFAAMKPGSLLINVGRGGLVDETALLASLAQGKPGRAVLDVFKTEPLPADSPLWDHPRVHVSAHASAFGSGKAGRSDAQFLDNLGRYVRGEPLRNLVSAEDLRIPAAAPG